MNKVQLTKQGLINLRKEYDDLIKIKRPKAIARLKNARSMGDLSENSEYTAAKEGLAFLDGRIQEIERLLKNVEVVKKQNHNHHITVGSAVEVDIDGIRSNLHIVGEFEADPLKKKLSFTSPIGKALLNKKVGEEFEIEVPEGKKKYKILQIK